MQALPNGYVVRKSDGAVVTHPALVKMPFEHSIEPWVRAYFPEAAYDCRNAPRVDTADIAITEPGVCVLQAPKGTGKSKAICAAVSRLDPKTSIVQITFRRSLAWSSASMLGPGAALYSSIADTAISARNHPRLTIVINSVTRIRGAYDVVVIDEIVSVLDMLSGTLLDADARVQTCAVLASLIASARTVVIADAMLDATCVDFVMLCRNGAPTPLRFVDYVMRIHADYAYVPHATLDTWMAAVRTAVQAGQRVVVPCMTKAQALRVRDACARLIPGDQIVLYTADTDPTELRAHMSDIHTHWARARVLIYSPVITAGCSFELPHFDTVFFYGYTGTGAVRSAIQMIARVRDVRTKTVHVFIGGADTAFAAIDVHALTAPKYMTVRTYRDCFMALLHLMDTHRAIEARCAAEAFAYYFWSLVVHAGARIAFPAKSDARVSSVQSLAQSSPLSPAIALPETWWAHDWTAAAAVLDYEPGCAVSVSGALLERVAKLHPNHLIDSRIVSCMDQECVRVTGTGIRLPDWVTRESSPRFFAWVHLMALKAFSSTAPEHVGMTRTAVCRRQFMHDEITPHVLIYAPACARVRNTGDAEQSAAYVKAVNAYLNPCNTWMDVTQDAWVLAAMDVALRKNVQPGASTLFETPMPTSAVPDALQIITNVQACLDCVTDACVYVDVNAAWGDADAAYAKRNLSACALAHFVLTEVDSKRTHLVAVRADGSPNEHGFSDLTKLAILAAAEDDVDVASLTVLYVLHGAYVRTRALHASSTLACSIARSFPAYVPAWKPLDRRGFIWVPAIDAVAVYVYWGSTLYTCTDAAELETRFGSADVDTWVSWGFTQWLQHASIHLNTACCAYDMEATVHAKLRLMDDGILCIQNASVVSVHDLNVGAEDASYLAMQALVRLFLGTCVKRFFVYFWNGKPHAVRVPAFHFKNVFKI